MAVVEKRERGEGIERGAGGGGDGGGGQGAAATLHCGVQAADRAGGGPLHTPGRDWGATAPRGVVLLAPDDLARGAGSGRARGAVAEAARAEGHAARPARQEDRRAGARDDAVEAARGAGRGAGGGPKKSCRAPGSPAREREVRFETVREVGPRLGIAPTCAALEVSTASYYRRRKPKPSAPPRPTPARALAAPERAAVLEVLHAPRFVDLAPAQVYAHLLDEGRYLCSPRTMYRMLAASAEVRERRDQLRHPRYVAPQLLATRPNELWSWDITKLLGPVKWTYFYLYVILDVFSRYVVGWMVAHRESARLAQKLIAETCARQGIAPGALTLHADRGSSMTSKPVALRLADLGVTKTHSRPTSRTTTPSRRRSSRRSSIGRSFPSASGRLKTPGRTVGSSSPGTTPSIGTAGSACSPRTMCTTAWPTSGSPRAPEAAPPPTPPARSASSPASRGRPPRPPRR